MYVHRKAATVRVEVRLFVGGKEVPIPRVHLQRQLLVHWYKYSMGLSGSGEVPRWLR